ncbi:hydroxysqualene dehydroxylase [Microvirga rosea]|uniref:hydroxysqualene dehydroxylase n=1 Tax=Microvirga rosea TaxID=2715425 RepID=UPI001D09D609|nr:FAD-dependent oxidoreductase [Microvirga rosea]MCB8822988.1 FAD-dependent oxidoreductase [Microvirga rosea]
MAGQTHIVGAGIAGLSAALSATSFGRRVVLYEAAPQIGGRCRTIQTSGGFQHDNGTHALLSANRRTLAFLKTVGARKHWLEPEPEGITLYNSTTGSVERVGLSPWSWLLASQRPSGLSASDLPLLVRLAFSRTDRPVKSLVGNRPILKNLLEPLTVSVLNTPVEEASSQRLGEVLRRLLYPGSVKLLVAERSLSQDLADPASHELEARGAKIFLRQRLRQIHTADGRAVALAFNDRTLILRPEDQVILALPPWEIQRLLPKIPVPTEFESIINIHFRCDGAPRPRFVGLLGTMAQWVLVRSDHVSVTISAARAVIEQDPGTLIKRTWKEIVPVLRHLGLSGLCREEPAAKLVKERRATIRQSAGLIPQTPVRPLLNLALAGDWLGRLPATIESAVTSGEEAISALSSADYSRHLPGKNNSVHMEAV